MVKTVSTKSHDAIEFAHLVQRVVADPTPTHERELVMGLFVALYVATQIAKFSLPRVFPKIHTITPARQRQIFTLWPMIILKLTVCYLTAEAEYATRFQSAGLRNGSKTFELMHHQTNVFYILVLGYIFELLYRPNPIELDYHHVFVLMGYSYYRLRFARVSDLEAVNPVTQAATINLFHLVTIMVIFGVGPVDLASETIRFVYYAIDAKSWSANIMRICVGVTWVGRLSQWYVMLEHLAGSVTSLVEALGWFEMGVCTAFIAYWIWMETVEIVFLIGLSKRYAGRIVQRKAD